MAETKSAVSLEEFRRMAAETDDRLELVGGEVLRMSPPGSRHGRTAIRVSMVLAQLVPKDFAEVWGDIGLLFPNGDVRAPDACVVSTEHIRSMGGVPEGWWTGPLLLAVEVIGTEERASQLQRKTEQYFANDVRQVWWVNPDTRKVTVYRGPKQVEIFGDEDELTAMDVHPALRFPVSKLFE